MLKLLVLAPFPPRMDGRHGGARALASLHRRLATRHRVVVLALRAEREPAFDPALAQLCEQVVEIPRPIVRREPRTLWAERGRVQGLLTRRPGWVLGTDVAAFHRAVREALARHRPDVLHAEFAVMAQYARHAAGTAVVVTDHSVAADGLDDAAMLRYRRAAYAKADALVAFTDEDRNQLRTVVDSRIPVHTIPLGVEIPRQTLDPTGTPPPRLLFAASFQHPPNVDALRRIVEGVLPAVRAAEPSAGLIVVGADPPRDLVDGRDGIVATGEVPDVRPYVEEASVVLAPVWSGGGMRVKALEALAAGKALVATPLGVAGLALDPAKHALIAERENDLARAIVSLLRDPEERRRLGAAGRAHVAAHFDWDEIASRYDAVYEQAASRR